MPTRDAASIAASFHLRADLNISSNASTFPSNLSTSPFVAGNCDRIISCCVTLVNVPVPGNDMSNPSNLSSLGTVMCDPSPALPFGESVVPQLPPVLHHPPHLWPEVPSKSMQPCVSLLPICHSATFTLRYGLSIGESLTNTDDTHPPFPGLCRSSRWLPADPPKPRPASSELGRVSMP